VTGSDWSRVEVEATVASYFDMLASELRGAAYRKAEHRRRLLPLLSGRTKGSVEYKLQNVSAVLLDLGFPYIDGYKPARNYQQLLYDVVAERLAADRRLQDVARRAVEDESELPEVQDILERLVDRPPPSNPRPAYRREGRESSRQPPPPGTPSYLERETRNRSLGLAGEQFVISYEQARLVAAGRESLASRVEHVSRTRGDHLGYDVLSFEADTRERLIEVKTTSFGPYTPFYVSRNQVEVSSAEAERYHLYRLFRFRSDPKFFGLEGALDHACRLDPTEYVARI